MENAVDAEQFELPRAEQLARLYELRDQIERVISRRGVSNPRSESERHLQLYGHRLEFGCCRARK